MTTTTTGTTTTDDEIEREFFPFLRVYKSGRIQRLMESPFLPAGLDPATSTLSKDVLIDPSVPLSARLYLPSSRQENENKLKKKKLPLLVYFHGGAFCIETPFSPTYHPYLNRLSARAGVLAVSVHYRRLPDHPLPAAYDDSWAALSWAASRADPWIRAFTASGGEIYLAGDSAGANIVHQMMVRASTSTSDDDDDEMKMKMKGAAVVHPYFWRRTGEEGTDEEMMRCWRMVNPGSKGWEEDGWINPQLLGTRPRIGKVVVSVAEKDFLAGRGREYAERLREEEGVAEVELWETEGVGHVFHLLEPETEAADMEMERMVRFFNGR